MRSRVRIRMARLWRAHCWSALRVDTPGPRTHVLHTFHIGPGQPQGSVLDVRGSFPHGPSAVGTRTAAGRGAHDGDAVAAPADRASVGTDNAAATSGLRPEHWLVYRAAFSTGRQECGHLCKVDQVRAGGDNRDSRAGVDWGGLL